MHPSYVAALSHWAAMPAMELGCKVLLLEDSTPVTDALLVIEP